MGGAPCPKSVWRKHGLPCFWCAAGVASNKNLTKSWYGKGKVGVAPVTPTIRHSPPMHGSEPEWESVPISYSPFLFKRQSALSAFSKLSRADNGYVSDFSLLYLHLIWSIQPQR